MVPAVNQVEVHPYFTNEEVRAYGRENGIVTEAWSPIAQGAVLDDPVVARVADAVRRTPAQVVLRWHLQRGDVVFPKSVTPARIEENFALFDFELDDDAMQRAQPPQQGPHGPHRRPTRTPSTTSPVDMNPLLHAERSTVNTGALLAELFGRLPGTCPRSPSRASPPTTWARSRPWRQHRSAGSCGT